MGTDLRTARVRLTCTLWGDTCQRASDGRAQRYPCVSLGSCFLAECYDLGLTANSLARLAPATLHDCVLRWSLGIRHRRAAFCGIVKALAKKAWPRCCPRRQ